MHSERDIYAHQLYSTALRENARLAKAKITTVDEFDSNSQIYINVFERKSRLSAFADITVGDDNTSVVNDKDSGADYLSKESDDSDRLFEDFGEIAIKAPTLHKRKTGKGAQKKRIVLQEVHTSSQGKNFNNI